MSGHQKFSSLSHQKILKATVLDLNPSYHHIGKQFSDPDLRVEPLSLNHTINDPVDRMTAYNPIQRTATRLVITRDTVLLDVDAFKYESRDVTLTSLAYTSTLDTGEYQKVLLHSKIVDPLVHLGVPNGYVSVTEEDSGTDDTLPSSTSEAGFS